MLVRTKANYKWYALSCTTLGALLSVAGAVIGPILGGFLNGLHRAFWLSFIISVVAAVVALMRGPHEVYYPQTGSDTGKS